MPRSDDAAYRGKELELFERAVRWKHYWSASIRPYLRGRCLEVGAGRGNNTALLFGLAREPRWTCVEPDPELRAALYRRLAREGLDDRVRVLGTTPDAASAAGSYDAVLYLDVLEHIEDDRGELERAAALLAAGGHLVVLAPAHDFLFSEFDAAIGHHRRFDLDALRERTPPGCRVVEASYLDSMGILASLANRLVLRQSLPTVAQIETWDRLLVPVSRVLDRLTLGRLGKSLRMVWRKIS